MKTIQGLFTVRLCGKKKYFNNVVIMHIVFTLKHNITYRLHSLSVIKETRNNFFIIFGREKQKFYNTIHKPTEMEELVPPEIEVSLFIKSLGLRQTRSKFYFNYT